MRIAPPERCYGCHVLLIGPAHCISAFQDTPGDFMCDKCAMVRTLHNIMAYGNSFDSIVKS
jgi:hypothetical protein